MRVVTTALIYAVGVFLVGCGVSQYPGQPGRATDNYSKIDLENLDSDGLWVYEAVYDNAQKGKGVGAILTKLYPGALTYTSNVRTNADGTLYFHKGEYAGAELQMISLPESGVIHLAPNSKVQLLIQYATSLNEMDARNKLEEGLFSGGGAGRFSALSQLGTRLMQFRFDLFRATHLTRAGKLAFDLTAVDLGEKKFVPSQTVHAQTSFYLNSLQLDLSQSVRAEAMQFLETNYPKGYQGKVRLHLKGAALPLEWEIGLHTLTTARAAGLRISNDGTEELAKRILAEFSGKS